MFLLIVVLIQNFFMAILSALIELAVFENKDIDIEHFNLDVAPVLVSLAFYT